MTHLSNFTSVVPVLVMIPVLEAIGEKIVGNLFLFMMADCELEIWPDRQTLDTSDLIMDFDYTQISSTRFTLDTY